MKCAVETILEVTFSWTNPDDDFVGTMIVYRNNDDPADYNDGNLVYDLGKGLAALWRTFRTS